MKTIVHLMIVFFLIVCFGLKGQNLAPIGGFPVTGDDGSIYWFTTIAFTVINGTTTYFNIKKLHKYDRYRSNAIFGAMSGVAQIAVGYTISKEMSKNASLPSILNIGGGLTTLATSIIRLVTKNPPKKNNLTIHLVNITPYGNKKTFLGLTLKMQLK